MKFYAGIGSRETPPDVQDYMLQIAARLEDRDYVLRSGGAPGADSAFEAGIRLIANYRIYIPWSGFNGRHGENVIVCGSDPTMELIAAASHPAWGRCTKGARRMHTRNVAQILGFPPEDYVDSEFVICWTPHASGSGGTGQAIRIAQRHNIPVYDLADEKQAAALESRIVAMALPSLI